MTVLKLLFHCWHRVMILHPLRSPPALLLSDVAGYLFCGCEGDTATAEADGREILGILADLDCPLLDNTGDFLSGYGSYGFAGWQSARRPSGEERRTGGAVGGGELQVLT